MRIATQITVAVVGWTLLVLLGFGYFRLRSEIALLEHDLSEECQLAGHLVEEEVVRAWRDQGIEGASLIADRVGAANAGLSARPVVLSGDCAAPMCPLHQGWASPGRTSKFWRVSGDDGAAIITYLRLEGGQADAALELQASLRAEREFVARTGRELAVVALLIALVAIWLSQIVGWRMVGRKVRDLVAVAHAAVADESMPPLTWNSDDELSELGKEMELMHAQLASGRVQQRRSQLIRAELRQKLRHSDRLAAAGLLMARVAHDVGTPLAVVAGRLHRLRSRVDAPLTREVGAAIEQVDRIGEILRALLDYVRSEDEPGVVDVGAAVQRATDLVSAIGDAKGIRIACSVPSEQALVPGRELAVEQAVVNLLVNAVHASPPGERVAVAVQVAKPDLGGGRRLEPTARIVVTDAGPGVSDDVRGAIFEPLFTTKPLGAGTGLGLAISQSIASEHGGTLELDESFVGGARFVMELPGVGRDGSDSHRRR